MNSKYIFRLGLILIFACHSTNLMAQVKDLNQFGCSNVFIENKGQFQLSNGQKNDSILYVLKSQNVDVVISNNSLHYFFKSTSNKVDNVFNANNSKVGITASNSENNVFSELNSNKKIDLYRLDMYLKGAQYPSKIKSENVVDYYENYYNLKKSVNGLTKVYGCEKIILENVYEGIDWIIYLKNEELKYDFIVHPFANRNKIQLNFKGQSSLKLDFRGNLIAETPVGSIQEKAPQSYQNGKLVNTQFEIKNDVVRFNYSDEIDGAKELIVDPCLSWGTYYGYSNDYVTKNFKDKSKNIYIVGYTSSNFYISTTGAHQTAYFGSNDGFIVKFDKNGKRLWATYYGGSNYDQILSGISDGSNNIYVTGLTYSTSNISTTGGFKVTNSGVSDAFLAKFNSSGAIQWGTYYGGSNDEVFYDIAIDGSSNIYAVGYTKSTGMATSGASQTSLGGGLDGLIVKFTNAGSRVWSTYSGGSGSDILFCAGIDNASNLTVAGYTTSTTSIATAGTQQTFFGGNQDGFVVKYTSAGAKSWGTYIGGTGSDEISCLTLDGSNNIWIGGRTQSFTAIATSGCHQSSYSGGDDGFVMKLNSSGVRQYGSYYGGNGNDYLKGIKLDISGNIYLGGYTSSSNAIATSNSHQSTLGGSSDVFLAKFNGSGVRQWATYYGGSNNDELGTIETDSNDVVYIAGSTNSYSNIATSGSFLNTLNGNNAFLAKFDPTAIYVTTQTSTVCKYTVVTFSALKTSASTYSWNSGQNTNSITTAKPTNYYVKYSSALGCAFVDTFNLLNYTIPGQSYITQNGLFCQTGVYVGLQLNTNLSVLNYRWYNSGGSLISTSNSISVNQEDKYKCVVTVNPNSCKDTAIYKLVVSPIETNIPKAVNVICGESYIMPTQSNYNSGLNYSWTPSTGINGYTSVKQPLFTPKQNTKYILTTSYYGQCIQKDTVDFVISNAPAPQIKFTESKTQCYGSNFFQFSSMITPKSNLDIRYHKLNPVSVYPALPDIDDTVTIYYNAKAGNAKLAGSSAVYIYTGLITNKSSNLFDWKHVVGNTTGALSYCKMKSLGNDNWSITLPIKSFYGKNDPVLANENGLQMAFIFHNSTGTKIGNGTFDEDIYYPMYNPNLMYNTNDQLKLVKPNVNESQEIFADINEKVPLCFSTGMKMDKLILYIDGVNVRELNNTDTLTYYLSSTYARTMSIRIYALNNSYGNAWQRYYTLYTLNPSSGISYKWDFGDTKNAYYAGPINQYYGKSGNFTVKLDVNDGACSYDQATTNVVILPKISPSMILPSNPYCLKEEFKPDASSSSIQGGITGVTYNINYLWKFGDGSQSTSSKPIKLYSKPATYKIVLRTSGSQLCEDSAIAYVQINDQPNLTVTCNNAKYYSCLNGTEITASPGYDIYSWSTGETGRVITRTDPGISDLTAYTNAGCTAKQRIELFPHPDLTFTSDNNFTYCNELTPVTISAQLGYKSYTWNTGQTGSEIQVNSPGFYSVSALDDNCLFSSTTKIEDGSKISADFGFEILSSYKCKFIPKSNQAKFAAWNFGDGGVSIDMNPVHDFQGNGKYNVCLNLMNTCRLRSNLCKTLTFPMLVGAENIENGHFLLFPNPGTGKYRLIIPRHTGFIKYQITDLKGKLVQCSDKFDVQNYLQLNASSGIYLLTIEMDGMRSTQKIDHINN